MICDKIVCDGKNCENFTKECNKWMRANEKK